MSDPNKEVQTMSRINRYVDRQLADLDTQAAGRVLAWFKDVVSKKEIPSKLTPPAGQEKSAQEPAQH